MNTKHKTISDKLNQMADGVWASQHWQLQPVLKDAMREGLVERSAMAEAFRCHESHLDKAFKTAKGPKIASAMRTLGFGSKG